MANECDRGRKQEQEAVRTTIVGGRPPGCGKSVGQIPRGIEVLVKKAAVDGDFRALLLWQRGGAAKTIGLELSAAENMMLSSVPAAQLQSIIDATTVPPGHMPAFLGKVAAVMLAALGIIQGGCDSREQARPAGIRPEDAGPRDNVAVSTRPTAPAENAKQDLPVVVAGAVVAPYTPPPSTRPANAPGDESPVVVFGATISRPEDLRTRGIRPLRPPTPPTTAPTTAPAKGPMPRGVAGIMPERPQGAGDGGANPRVQPIAGIISDRPQETVIRGLRADEPRRPPTTQPAIEQSPDHSGPGNTTVLGLMTDRPNVRGARADRPRPPSTQPAEPPWPGNVIVVGLIADRPSAIKGIRTDRPDTTTTQRTTPPTTQPSVQPVKPQPPMIIAGIMPAEPPQLSRGIRPDRPPAEKPTSRPVARSEPTPESRVMDGIRPDRPERSK